MRDELFPIHFPCGKSYHFIFQAKTLVPLIIVSTKALVRAQRTFAFSLMNAPRFSWRFAQRSGQSWNSACCALQLNTRRVDLSKLELMPLLSSSSFLLFAAIALSHAAAPPPQPEANPTPTIPA